MKKADLILRATYLPYIGEGYDSKGWNGSDGHLYLARDLPLHGYELLYTREGKYGTNYYYRKVGSLGVTEGALPR